MQLHDYKVLCLSEAVSPVTHMSGSVGNEAIIARETIVTPRGKMDVPILSGNAVRHRSVRDPGAWHLIETWGLHGSLTLEQLNFLFHGGNLTQSTAHENTRRIADWNRLFPLGKLLGGCLPNQILKGSMQAWRGNLVCEENRQTLEKILPDGFALPEQRLQSAEAMVCDWQYTRGDAKKLGLLPDDANVDVASNLMIFSGQAVARGSLFVHGFDLLHVTSLELGALLHCLTTWQAQGGTIGGQAARGHGRLKTSVYVDGLDGSEHQGLIDAYAAHVVAHEGECIAWLKEVFAPVVDKPKGKAKKGKVQQTLEVAEQ